MKLNIKVQGPYLGSRQLIRFTIKGGSLGIKSYIPIHLLHSKLPQTVH
jgi:hypothetical protein